MAQAAPPAPVLPYRSGGGRARLSFVLSAGRTEMDARLAASPMKLLSPRTTGPVAWALSSHYGGGMVPGDRLDLGLELGPGAQALISTQAPGKVYGGEPGVEQRLAARVAHGAALAWLPDPLACFAGARYRQEQDLDLEAGASLLWCEALSCGRALRGERWSFDSFSSRLRVRRTGRLILAEGLRLEGPGLARRFGRYGAFASVFLVGPAFAAGAKQLLARVNARPPAQSMLAEAAGPWAEDGALLRLAAASPEALQAALRRCLAFIPPWLGQDPWARRLPGLGSEEAPCA